MGKSIVGSVLAFSAILAMGAGQGWAKPDLAGQSRTALPAPVPGQSQGNPAARDTEEPRNPQTVPVQEDKTDCDDCVIVLRDEAAGGGSGAAGDSGRTGNGSLLAGTLWGLFGVSRPRRIPRTYIRGKTAP